MFTLIKGAINTFDKHMAVVLVSHICMFILEIGVEVCIAKVYDSGHRIQIKKQQDETNIFFKLRLDSYLFSNIDVFCTRIHSDETKTITLLQL